MQQDGCEPDSRKQVAWEARQPTLCAREGCSYMATWHPHYCCVRCNRNGTHGPRCEKKDMPKGPNTNLKTMHPTFDFESMCSLVPEGPASPAYGKADVEASVEGYVMEG